MAAMRLTAGAPLDVLVKALAKADWGLLQGRSYNGVRNALRALADLLPSAPGEGVATAYQISRVSGHGVRWTRVVLQWLEDYGLIVWQRGGVWAGKPKPGWIRVNKWKLVELIRAARPAHDQATKDQQERTRARLAKLGAPTLKNRVVRLCRSAHGELSSDRPFTRTVKRAQHGAARLVSVSTSTTTTTAVVSGNCSKDLEAVNYPTLNPSYLPDHCPHDIAIPIRCPQCRAVALRLKGKDERDYQPQKAAFSGTSKTPETFALVSEEIPELNPLDKRLALRRRLDDYMNAHYPNANMSTYFHALKDDPYARELNEQLGQPL